MSAQRAARIIASLTIASVVVLIMVLTHGPTWAWLGIGALTYLTLVNTAQ